MKILALIGALALACLTSACGGLSTISTIATSSVTVTSNQVVTAAAAFNVVEAVATDYLKQPPCPAAIVCRTPVVVSAIVPPLRAGYAARARLVAAAAANPGAPVVLSDYSLLIGAVTTLKGLFAQYGING